MLYILVYSICHPYSIPLSISPYVSLSTPALQYSNRAAAPNQASILSLLLPSNIHLPPHRIIVGCVLRLHHRVAVHLVVDRLEIDQRGHVLEEIRHLVSPVSVCMLSTPIQKILV